MNRTVLILVALLVSPALAGWRLAGSHGILLLLGWSAAASSLTYLLYATDKRRAQRDAWRVPESTLHLCALAGGWPGAFLAQQRLRHKNSKPAFLVVFWLVVGLHQFAAVDYLLGWRWTRAAAEAAGGATKPSEKGGWPAMDRTVARASRPWFGRHGRDAHATTDRSPGF